MTDYRRLLLNLLAVIHGDGGHYTDINGAEKSTTDAMKKFHKMKQEAENLRGKK